MWNVPDLNLIYISKRFINLVMSESTHILGYYSNKKSIFVWSAWVTLWIGNLIIRYPFPLRTFSENFLLPLGNLRKKQSSFFKHGLNLLTLGPLSMLIWSTIWRTHVSSGILQQEYLRISALLMLSGCGSEVEVILTMGACFQTTTNIQVDKAMWCSCGTLVPEKLRRSARLASRNLY